MNSRPAPNTGTELVKKCVAKLKEDITPDQRKRYSYLMSNKNEIDKVIKYIQRVNYWNNLFDIKSKNKNSILKSLGSLPVDHKLFHVRTCNADLINEIGDVDLSDPYNNIDMTKKIVFDCDENIEKYSLKNDEFILLKILILKPGQVFSVDYLINNTLLGLSNTNELYSLVQRIREKIEKDPREPKRLITVRGVGYKLVTDG